VNAAVAREQRLSYRPPRVTAALVDAARALFPRIREAAEIGDRERRLPAELVTAFTDAGFFRACVPRTLGGEEADAATLLGMIEEIARADGSAGWCVMIGATTGLVAGYLPDDEARAVYGDPSVVTGGVLAPRGTATPVAGGYRVSGRWPFASGCQHSAWLVGGCLVEGSGPEPVTVIFPAADVEVVDTWTVSGLCGTGSHDIAVRDVFVPSARCFSLVRDRPRQSGPLYRFALFGLLAASIAAVTVGIARAAIETLVDLAGGKRPTGSRRMLAERAMVQAEVARAEATLRSARAFLFEAVGQAWHVASAGRDLGVRERAIMRLAATSATTGAAAAVDRAYDAGGGTSIYATSRLQRCFRDVHAATQHAMVAPATLELVGRLLLGLETDTAML